MHIVFCFLLYIINNAITSDGENVILPKLAAANGWEYAHVLLIASVAGCLSILGQLVMGRICAKKDARFTIVLCLCLSAFFLLLYGSAQTMWVYAVGLFGVICCSMSYSYMGANALIANWFPTKKGIAMGFVSVGAPVSTVCMVSVLTLSVNRLGLPVTVRILSGVLLVLALVCLLWIRNRPEEYGETPDGLPLEEVQALMATEKDAGVSKETLSVKALLSMKETWLIIGIIGVCSMSQTGLMAQFVVRYTQSGYAESTAIVMLSVCAAIGIFGSMLSGNLEHRLGTRRAYGILALIFAAALVINFTNVAPLIWVSIPLFGINITILQIFLTSFELAVYGRDNFRAANAIIFPVICMLGQVSLLVISVCIRLFGEVRYAYLIFAVLLVVSTGLNQKLMKNR